ncbi:hypothetical protein [Limoniibacter endophyticus]|uniref:DUF2029 domain-containing protein n=1 Tax=Limoniibacter endophyticus TaxID=1565040 RepID=A0A8J3DQ14_9HYPH|nr:hypothetical protein [Limoniibacter endophyticus]GHC75476.1 hypothetical protein GCM10010136_25450 [Limoniibacter endophyticus]
MVEGERNLAQWFFATGAGGSIVGRVAARRFLDRFAGFFFLFSILALTLYGVVRPDYNWDMVAYVGTALEDRYTDAETLHAETWKRIEAGADEGQQFHLKFSNPYNLAQWENPDNFQSQLSMYRVKVAYIWLLRLLEPAIGLIDAIILLSALPAFLIGLTIFAWLKRTDSLQAGFLLIPFLWIADYARLAAVATPDALACVVALWALYLLYFRKEMLGCLVLVLSVLVRPDNIILVFAFLITAIVFRWRLLPYLVAFVASLIASMLISKYGGHPGWWAHFYFSCVQIQNSMTGFQPDFNLSDLAKGYARGLKVSLDFNDWPALLLIGCGGWALLAKYGSITRMRVHAFIFAMLIGTLGKFASFPLPDDRFYLIFIMGLFVCLAVQWKPRFNIENA